MPPLPHTLLLMSLRTRLMIVSVLAVAITMAGWGWVQLRVLDKLLFAQQRKTLSNVAETIATYYHNFPTGKGLSALVDALNDHIQSNMRLARIDIITLANGDIEYVAGVGRIDWGWADMIASSPPGKLEKPRFITLQTEEGPALGLLYPVPPEKNQRLQEFVGVIMFSQSNMEILSRARRLLIISGLALLLVIMLVLAASYDWLIGRPLRTIIQGIDAFQKGQYVKRIELRRRDELGHVVSHFNAMAAEIESAMERNRELTRRLEDRVQEATRKVVQLQQQVNQLQQLGALGYLTATLAHDLGTPLHSIAGLASLLLERNHWPPDVSRKLELIVQQTQRLNTVIQNVRAVTRLPEPHFEVVGAAELLQDALLLLEPLAQKAGIPIRLEAAADLPFLYVDRHRIQTALFNLVDNALEAMDHGGEIVITAHTTAQRAGVVVAVCDNGPGIPAELLERVCEPFFSTRENAGLRGLGLAIVKDILVAHGGRMEIESSSGVGTRVVLYFPLVEVESAPSPSGLSA